MSAVSPEPPPATLSYRHPRTGEWAHDARDPLGEAREVFVAPAWAAFPPPAGELGILEVGFGRGLNTACALARLRAAGHPGPVRVLGLEPAPERLRPWPPCPPELVPVAPWWGVGTGAWAVPDRPGWRVEVRRDRAPEGLEGCGPFHWLFLDLFSPGRHPEDWSPGLAAALRAVAAPGGVLTSYCVARSLRDALAAAGWEVERLPRGRSRHSLRARPPGQDGSARETVPTPGTGGA